jgi:lipopolysaccharide transport system permease protein
MSKYLEIWNYRELFYFLAWRDVKIRFKQTGLGVAWVVIQPLFTMIIFTFLFGRVAKLPSDGTPHPLFYFCGLLPWIYFSTTLTLAGNSLVSNSNLLTKVYFPRLILPASAVLGGALDFAIGSILLLGFIAYYRIPWIWSMLLWPVLLIHLMLLTFGIGMIFAALNVKYRDIKYALPFAVQLWLFVTPVIYPASMIPNRYRPLIACNPMTGIIEAFRYSVSPSKGLDWQLLGVSLLTTLLVLIVGVGYFGKTEKAFADIV